MGIPVISNSGVGDVEKIIKETSSGFIFHDFTEQEYNNLIAEIPALLKKDHANIRNSARKTYDLSTGVQFYWKAYKNLFCEI